MQEIRRFITEIFDFICFQMMLRSVNSFEQSVEYLVVERGSSAADLQR